jgi:hypothetical protein
VRSSGDSRSTGTKRSTRTDCATLVDADESRVVLSAGTVEQRHRIAHRKTQHARGVMGRVGVELDRAAGELRRERGRDQESRRTHGASGPLALAPVHGPYAPGARKSNPQSSFSGRKPMRA